MKNSIILSKKPLLVSLLCCIILWISSITFATIEPDQQNLVDDRLLQLHSKIELYSQPKQQIFYNFFIKKVISRITSDNREILNYIVLDLESKITKDTVVGHNSIILRFTTGGNYSTIINEKKESIASSPSVFIFRSWRTNLSSTEIKGITAELKAINSQILIFIDQEWGAVNRYIDFASSQDVDNLFNDTFASNLLSNLSQSEQALVRNIFPQSSGYFPSLWTIWIQYDKFSTDASKQTFLDIIAYMRLESLNKVWINTYWLVADLNLWNPAISPTGRSFSQHENKYIKFIDSFIDASEKTGVSLYLKHFPGHGAWSVDSHQGILDLTNSTEYLQNNMAVFEYFLDNKKTPGWLMIGHIVFDTWLNTLFSRIIKKSDYLLTDDLAMQGFKRLENDTGETLSFSTNIILKQWNIIRVDTQYVESVY